MGIPEKVFKKVALSLFVLAVVWANQARAEVRAHARGFFWIDVPEEWQWAEDRDGATIASPNGRPSIRIDFVSTDGVDTPQDERKLLQDTMARRIAEVGSRNGKPVLRVERRLGGAFALQAGFLISTPEGMRQATAIVFFRNGYLFDIYFEAWREFQRLEMEKIIDTMTFEPPRAEEPKEGAAEAAGALLKAMLEAAKQPEIQP